MNKLMNDSWIDKWMDGWVLSGWINTGLLKKVHLFDYIKTLDKQKNWADLMIGYREG